MLDKIKLKNDICNLVGYGYIGIEDNTNKDMKLTPKDLKGDLVLCKIENVGQTIVDEMANREFEADYVFEPIKEDLPEDVDLEKLLEISGLDEAKFEVDSLTEVELEPVYNLGCVCGYDYVVAFDYDLSEGIEKYNEWVEKQNQIDRDIRVSEIEEIER